MVQGIQIDSDEEVVMVIGATWRPFERGFFGWAGTELWSLISRRVLPFEVTARWIRLFSYPFLLLLEIWVQWFPDVHLHHLRVKNWPFYKYFNITTWIVHLGLTTGSGIITPSSPQPPPEVIAWYSAIFMTICDALLHHTANVFRAYSGRIYPTSAEDI